MIIALTVSVLVNIFLIWYLVLVLKKLYFVSNNINDLVDMINNYSAHLESVYNLENYYGDQTLQVLLDHSKEISEELKAYEKIYGMIEETEEEIDEEIEEETLER